LTEDRKWYMNFTPSKTLALLISNKINPNRQPTLQMNNTDIEEFSSHNYLGLIFTEKHLRLAVWEKLYDNNVKDAYYIQDS